MRSRVPSRITNAVRRATSTAWASVGTMAASTSGAEITRALDAVAARRRRLSGVEKNDRFEGPDREVGLLELFAGHSSSKCITSCGWMNRTPAA
jgi:predicted dithiol-disulfide oxidoreductase (DUF899 family)